MGGDSQFLLPSEEEVSAGTTPPPPQPSPPTKVTTDTFAIEKEYLITSADGSRFLTATNRKSGRGREFKDIQEILQSLARISIPSEEQSGIGGYSLDFERMDTAAKGPPPAAARFIFSGRAPDELRLHSTTHNNFMCFFLGAHEPREWVVWHTAVPTHGEWEVMALEWICEDGKDGELFKMKGHTGQYVKWVVQGFASTRNCSEASVFKLMEV